MRLAVCLVSVLLCGLAGAQVVEVPENSATEVALEAVVSLPKLTAGERGLLGVIVRALPRGTEQYSRKDMMITTDGAPVVTDLMADHVRVGFTVPPENLKAGISLMENLLRRARISAEDLGSPMAMPIDSWMGSLVTTVYPVPSLRADRVRDLYRKVFRPERVVLAVGGKFAPGEPTALWKSKVATWQVGREPTFRDDYTTATTRISENLLEIRKPAQFSPSMLLAVFALGSGKGSSLFRIAREELALSYRQEAILWPSEGGFETRLLVRTTQKQPGLEELRTALLKDVESWTEAERSRALGMAEAVMLRSLPFSPLYLSSRGPLSDSLSDRTFLAGYWTLKTGAPWNPIEMLANMRAVPLDALKSAARSILSP
jgi:predicted Zn-dependent peptidase